MIGTSCDYAMALFRDDWYDALRSWRSEYAARLQVGEPIALHVQANVHRCRSQCGCVPGERFAWTLFKAQANAIMVDEPQLGEFSALAPGHGGLKELVDQVISDIGAHRSIESVLALRCPF